MRYLADDDAIDAAFNRIRKLPVRFCGGRSVRDCKFRFPFQTTETRKTTVQAVKYCFTTHKKNKKPKTCEGGRARRKREAISVEAIGATGRYHVQH